MDTDHGSTSSSAPGPAAGYLYQLRYALFRALKKNLRDTTGSVGIERLDDVSIETSAAPVALEQLKHTAGTVTFTDKSFQVWRAIGNWIRVASEKALDLSRVDLVLVTNASVANESGLSFLGPDDQRDPQLALTRLRTAALSSESVVSKADRDRFLTLEEAVQSALVRATFVVANAPNLAALGDEIEDLVHYACEQSVLKDLREELEGWWFDRIASSFSTGEGALVALSELDARISYLREKYKLSSLTFDVGDEEEPHNDLSAYLFVRQVQVLAVGSARLRNAQRDFLKASAQRSKWLRAAKIGPEELNAYDDTLASMWSTRSAIVSDELQPAAPEEDKKKCGRELLAWAETQQQPLRGAAAQFLTSGSYHALADECRVGWHPDFKVLFKAGG